jgi:dTDP-glucose 4,6-dehydratase
MSKQRILLTGSAGFIGSNFVRQTIYEKHPYELYSVDKIANSSMLNNIYQHKMHEFYIADICDQHIMEKIFEYVRPDIVIHMAAESAVDKSINDPSVFIKSNVLGTQNLVNLSIKHGVKCFLYQSTDEVYGALKSTEEPSWTEESPLNPQNPYSASKACGELIVRAAANTHGLPFIIVRSCNNYGPRQTPDKLIPRAIKAILDGKQIPVYGEGLQVRDWMHTMDNGSAILRILTHGKIGETYNISGNQEFTNIEVVKEICNLMQVSHDRISFIKDPRPGHDFRYSVSSKKLADLGWRPVYKFKDGLAKTIEWNNLNQFFLKSA